MDLLLNVAPHLRAATTAMIDAIFANVPIYYRFYNGRHKQNAKVKMYGLSPSLLGTSTTKLDHIINSIETENRTTSTLQKKRLRAIHLRVTWC